MLNENAATDKQETHYIVVVLHKLRSSARLCLTNCTNIRADKTPADAGLEFHTKKIHKNLTQITFVFHEEYFLHQLSRKGWLQKDLRKQATTSSPGLDLQ